MRINKTVAALLITASVMALTASAQARTGSGSFFESADTNHDGVVSRAEFQASRDERFQSLDKNHDGVITAADFSDGQGAAVSDNKRGSRMLERLDANGDGKVSHDEYVSGSMERFDSADANHDGSISQDEALAMRHGHGDSGEKPN